jgi:hypothetical protein
MELEQRGTETHVSGTEASGGSKEGVVRWVLIAGLLLVVVAFAIIVMTGALSQPDGADSEYNVSNEIAAEENSAATDSQNGEPIAPGFDDRDEQQPDSNQGPDAAPSANATPGDAPAGDPRNTAQ